ncbi:hypothetical protein B0H16DRAFT_1728816 [Mycena metata]|uniref:Uncharacterized protein n=1 Tax=Mycena metata TaxID=1033252 RepID=A0AAD7IEB9_9AGAR|nr:hypothetical protein B0H16DRAFT_1728816 [Mycena metata]
MQCALTPSTAYTTPSSRHVSVSAAMMDVPSPAVPARPRLRAFHPPSLSRTPPVLHVSYSPTRLPPAGLHPHPVAKQTAHRPLLLFPQTLGFPPFPKPNRISSAFRVPSRDILYYTSPAARVFL